ncbi:hypothetical protein [Actinoplanes sp. NPDC026670]|uniref:hypothetical protein n=1 Tax=Actinoplanes sp. NPDC026670 TaxID=3154700 RepID=UPI0033F37B33
MKPLSDMLREAETDPPPPRYGVDDVVALGRRRMRRRNSVWALAAVVAVTAAIGVPQIVTRRADAPPVVTPSPQLDPSPVGGPSAAEFMFTGYTTGAFQVLPPERWSLESETAYIHRNGKAVGVLEVYHPGVQPDRNRGDLKRRPTDPVGAATAFFIDDSNDREIQLAWEYADGALATVLADPRSMSPAEMRQVAEAFGSTSPRPATIGFGLSYVPAGYHLIQVSTGETSTVRFQVDDEVRARLQDPDYEDPRPTAEQGHAPRGVVNVGIGPRERQGVEADITKTVCEIHKDTVTGAESFHTCVKPLPGGLVVRVFGGDYIKQQELRKILQGLTVYGTEKPVSDVLPATARPLPK